MSVKTTTEDEKICDHFQHEAEIFRLGEVSSEPTIRSFLNGQGIGQLQKVPKMTLVHMVCCNSTRRATPPAAAGVGGIGEVRSNALVTIGIPIGARLNHDQAQH